MAGEFTERLRYGARGELAQLMAAHAAVVLHDVEIAVLRDVLGNLRGAAELACVRNVHHRIPIDRRIIFRGVSFAGSDDRAVIDDLARLALDLGGIHKAIAAHPDVVIRLGQIRYQIAPAIIGHHNLRELGGQVGGFGNHPHTGFGAFAAGDCAG